MDLHQVSITYQPEEDRILLRIRTRQAQLLDMWFTRRLMARLWGPLDQAVATVALKGLSRDSTVVPEARQMAQRAQQERSRQGANFESPFDDSGAERPLGDRPLLVHAVDLSQPDANSLHLSLRDVQGRQVGLLLKGDLLHNVYTLLEHGLKQSEWGLTTTAASADDRTAPPPREPDRWLN